MHPALVAAIAAEQRRDQLQQAAATRRARKARRARRACDQTGPSRPRGSQPDRLPQVSGRPLRDATLSAR
jgi:hypothetical protein